MVGFGFHPLDATGPVFLDQDCFCRDALCVKVFEKLTLNDTVLVDDESSWITDSVPRMITGYFAIEDAELANDL